MREQGEPGYGFYDPEQAKNSNRRIAIKRAVAEATEQRRFQAIFNPFITSGTGELNGFEGSICLHDEELGQVSPAEFIPIAEEIGLINQIGAWAIEMKPAALPCSGPLIVDGGGQSVAVTIHVWDAGQRRPPCT